MLKTFSCLVFCFVLINACVNVNTTEDSTALGESASLFNTWEISSMSSSSLTFQGSTQGNQAHGSQIIKLTFFKENAISLTLSTNHCNLAYTLEGDFITFKKNITCTEACCNSNQDEFLMSQLSGTLKYSIKGKTLNIEAKNGPIQFRLSAL